MTSKPSGVEIELAWMRTEFARPLARTADERRYLDERYTVLSCALMARLSLDASPAAEGLVLEVNAAGPGCGLVTLGIWQGPGHRPLPFESDVDGRADQLAHSLCGGNAPYWQALCAVVDEEHGVYVLALDRALHAAGELL